MTASLEADELAVGMINLRVFKAHSSWSFTIPICSRLPGPKCTSPRPALKLLGAGGGSKKRTGAHPRARRR